MGLSNEERRSKIVWAIGKICQLKSEWIAHSNFKNREYKRMLGLIDGLWDGLFGGNSNALHWICGSSAGNRISSNENPTTPWELALIPQLEDAYKEATSEPDEDDPFNPSKKKAKK